MQKVKSNNMSKGINNDYIEEPWNIIETYFKGQHLESW